ncbi:hypothetical protein [Ancylobacter terrae]|uniref:hypothetical protein n=1 Tax=Ancylobacter sp. sgz301288 TaxID=3342077 RepID=UPI00385E37BC
MLYTEEVLDRRTGELTTISLGDWVTVTEFGEMMGVGPRRVRSILRHLDFVGVEGGGAHQRHCASRWAVREGLAKRIDPMKRGVPPFDVISPAGQEWLRARWSEAVSRVADRGTRSGVMEAKTALEDFQRSRSRHNMPPQEAVCWLTDHFPRLAQEDIAAILDITQQLASRYQNVQSKQRRKARERVEKMGRE